MPNNFDERCREIARRFLVSAVIVDDEPYYPEAQVGPLRTPSRADRTVDDEKPAGRGGQSLDVGAIAESFSKVGLICGVVKPAGDGDVDVAAVERADLVVIDWKLDDDGKRAMKLIRSILDSDRDKDQRLRLIVVYTGESGIGGIGKQISENLRYHEYLFEGVSKDLPVTLSRGHCHIEIYAKPDTPLDPELKNRSVSYADLPERLIDDFVRITAGLMPSIALVALTAVRENPHRVLDKFDSGLDAAFLAHRACLPIPDDSEQHMVAQIASELRAIMEEKVRRKQPAGMDAIKLWIEKFKGSESIEFGGGSIPRQEVFDMLEKGLAVSKPNSLSMSKAHSVLTAGFARDEDGDPKNLDLRLAWMTCFRAIDPPDKKLWLGTAVRRCGDSDSAEFLLCMRPRCDSVRRTGRESFLFLPLVGPRQKTLQLVVRSNANGPKYCQVTVETDMSRWEMIVFEPHPTAKAVVAQKEENGSAGYVFTDVDGNRYEWIGELKTEVAHSVGQTLSSTLSRIALDRSEWLRRSER